MIIGIDETGTFDLQKPGFSFFLAFHLLDKKSLEKFSDVLNQFKATHKSLKNEKGELKGKDLGEDEFNEFIDLLESINKIFYINYCASSASDHTKTDIQYHRDHHVKNYEDMIKQMQEVGNKRGANQLTELKNWYRKLRYQQLLKLWILGETIGESFRRHVIQVALEKQDLSLGYLSISIDRDFIKEPTHNIFWGDILRNQFYNYTYRNKIPIISEWPDDHPFYMAQNHSKYKSKEESLFVDGNHIFRKACNYKNSHNCVEIQIADILASIIAGFHNNNQNIEAYEKLKPHFILRQDNPFFVLQMSKAGQLNPNPAPDPYKRINKR